MPGLDGGNLANQLLVSPALKGVTIEFLTAAVGREELRQRRGVGGGRPFLAKPANLHEILGCLEQHLGRAWVPAASTAEKPLRPSADGHGSIRGNPCGGHPKWPGPVSSAIQGKERMRYVCAPEERQVLLKRSVAICMGYLRTRS